MACLWTPPPPPPPTCATRCGACRIQSPWVVFAFRVIAYGRKPPHKKHKASVSRPPPWPLQLTQNLPRRPPRPQRSPKGPSGPSPAPPGVVTTRRPPGPLSDCVFVVSSVFLWFRLFFVVAGVVSSVFLWSPEWSRLFVCGRRSGVVCFLGPVEWPRLFFGAGRVVSSGFGGRRNGLVWCWGPGEWSRMAIGGRGMVSTGHRVGGDWSRLVLCRNGSGVDGFPANSSCKFAFSSCGRDHRRSIYPSSGALVPGAPTLHTPSAVNSEPTPYEQQRCVPE